MRAIRRLLITLIVLAGLYVAADFGLKALAQSQTASTLETSLDLSKKPTVDLGGFPFLPRALGGHLDQVLLSGDDLSAGGQPLRGVHLTLHDVRFSASALVFGRKTSVRFASSDGTADLTGQDVTDALEHAGVHVRVRLAHGNAFVSGGGIPLEVRLIPSLDGQTLVLRPAVPLPVSLRIDLSGLLPDIRLHGIRLQGSIAVLTFSLARTRFDV
ncbi:MAG TPA: DUF2993 domain-containing protein [Actinomycetota bacterium]